MSWPWSELGLDGPSSLEEVRRAYAQRLKETHPEEDPEGFQRLHQAYQQARQAARRAGRAQTPPAPPQPERTPEVPFPPEMQPEPKPEPEQEPKPEPEQEQEPESEEAQQPQEEQWDFQRLFAEEARRQEETRRQQGGSTQNQRIDLDTQSVVLRFQEERQRREKRRKKPLRWLFIAAAALILLAVIIEFGSQLPHRRQARDICQYLQEDFGFTAQSLYDGRWEDAYRYYLPAQQLYFLAWPDGERDLSQGRLGYSTNLGNALLTQELESFGAQWMETCTLELVEEGGTADVYGGTPGGYVLSLSLWDSEDCVAALGELMDELAREDWYSQLAPRFLLRLAVWGQPFFTYTAPGDPFDGAGVLSYYRDDLKWDLASYLVEESGLAAMDFGEDVYWLEKMDTITLHGDTYVLLGGVDGESGETVRLYLYNAQYLISTPADTFDPSMGQLDYIHLTGGPKIEAPAQGLPWPYLGIVRRE